MLDYIEEPKNSRTRQRVKPEEIELYQALRREGFSVRQAAARVGREHSTLWRLYDPFRGVDRTAESPIDTVLGLAEEIDALEDESSMKLESLFVRVRGLFIRLISKIKKGGDE
jgi:hypothetical protein